MDSGAIEQIIQEVRYVLNGQGRVSWKPATCSKCGRRAPMVREMTSLDASDEEDGLTSSILIEWKPAEDGWVMWRGDGPQGVHCPDCNRKAVGQLQKGR